ncbi:Serine/threonine-protein kinase gad8 [Bifiguratus adelaidae]|uniref:non-specific serine/threonine protein kinase n=1 Tax=Bifiguratus adelaidae TaxID=1938954 RepID=A0A261XTE0_9FUNG|nr:Serine/threonine-protein kinase gad8 [Bifiguratus adelaidae]
MSAKMMTFWSLENKETTSTQSSLPPVVSPTQGTPPSSTSSGIVTPSGTSGSSGPTTTNASNRNSLVPKAGVLIIRVCKARNIALPPNVKLPPIPSQPQQAQSDAMSQNRNRESMTRKQFWWMPYAVVEFDKNEVVVDALGGDTYNPVWQYRAHFDVSRESEVSISIFLRHPPNPEPSSPTVATNDYYLGGVKLQPSFSETKVEDQWYEIMGGQGSLHLQLAYKPSQQNTPMTFDSFELLKVIGKGSFGKVYQVRKRDTNRIYAMKVIRKAHIISRSEVTHTLAERTVLAQINNPFIVPLKFSFQTPEKLYLVLAFINGGELFHHLQMEGRFEDERAKFYTAELLCALECLHGFNVIYRDLKPENILIDYNGHIALCDFGLCKLNMGEAETTNTFCGTPEYLAPELLMGTGYTKAVDWWTLGVLLYEMMTGLPPFYDENTSEMYRKILQDELRFPDDMGESAKSLLKGLLTRDPNTRLGNNGSQDIKSHPFFASIDWRRLMQKKLQPPFKPSVESAFDTSNFDEEFTSEVPLDSVVDDSHLSKTLQEQFKGFTYNPASDGVMGESLNTSESVGSNRW